MYMSEVSYYVIMVLLFALNSRLRWSSLGFENTQKSFNYF